MLVLLRAFQHNLFDATVTVTGHVTRRGTVVAQHQARRKKKLPEAELFAERDEPKQEAAEAAAERRKRLADTHDRELTREEFVEKHMDGWDGPESQRERQIAYFEREHLGVLRYQYMHRAPIPDRAFESHGLSDPAKWQAFVAPATNEELPPEAIVERGVQTADRLVPGFAAAMGTPVEKSDAWKQETAQMEREYAAYARDRQEMYRFIGLVSNGEISTNQRPMTADEKNRTLQESWEKLEAIKERQKDLSARIAKRTNERLGVTAKRVALCKKLRAAMKAAQKERGIDGKRWFRERPGVVGLGPVDEPIQSWEREAIEKSAVEFVSLFGDLTHVREFTREENPVWGTRAYYRQLEARIHIGAKTNHAALIGTVHHEMGHGLDHLTSRHCWRWVLSKRTSDTPRKLSEITRNSQYKDNETAIEGDFFSAYVGRAVPGANPFDTRNVGSTEVFSTAVERFCTPERMAEFFQMAPDQAFLVLGLVNGINPNSPTDEERERFQAYRDTDGTPPPAAVSAPSEPRDRTETTLRTITDASKPWLDAEERRSPWPSLRRELMFHYRAAKLGFEIRHNLPII
jgi:hypothetical protein